LSIDYSLKAGEVIMGHGNPHETLRKRPVAEFGQVMQCPLQEIFKKRPDKSQ